MTGVRMSGRCTFVRDGEMAKGGTKRATAKGSSKMKVWFRLHVREKARSRLLNALMSYSLAFNPSFPLLLLPPSLPSRPVPKYPSFDS